MKENHSFGCIEDQIAMGLHDMSKAEVYRKPKEIIEEELEKENAELKCECRRCVYTDSPCTLSDYGKDKNGVCDHFKDVFDENAELKEQNRSLLESCEGATMMYKDLCKAKELLKKLYSEIRGYMNDQGFDMNVINEVYDFIKNEVEK